MEYFVIGAGSIGTRHAQNLATLGAVVHHLPWRGLDMDALLARLHDLGGQAGVVIATATKVRLDIIRACADAGAALYIEKPVAYRSSDLTEIFKISMDIQKRSVAGFMMRYHPLVRYLSENIPNDMFRAHLEIGHDVTQWRQNWTFQGSYAADPQGGGVLLDLCHEIDLAQLFCQDVTLQSVLSTRHPELQGVDIASTVALTSDRGAVCSVSMDYLAPIFTRRGSLIGLDQEIRYDLFAQTVTTCTPDQYETTQFPMDRNDMFLGIMRDFMALARGHSPENPLCPRLDKTQGVCQLIAQAWATRDFVADFRARLT